MTQIVGLDKNAELAKLTKVVKVVQKAKMYKKIQIGQNGHKAKNANIYK